MHPILYSFRRCPYAIRTRMTLRYAQIKYELREVSLTNKPEAMINASAKATVPTMALPEGTVLDESIDIIYWALRSCDPDCWLPDQTDETAKYLLNENDAVFKQHLDHYKYADRFPDHPASFYRDQACEFLAVLERQLKKGPYLLKNHLSMVDVAVFPFVRQFAFVDKPWFDQAPYPAVQAWLQQSLDSDLFKGVMLKYAAWHENEVAVIIESNS